jgi:hypothetical protein
MEFTEIQKMKGLWVAIIPATLIPCFIIYKEYSNLFQDWKEFLPFLGVLLIMSSVILLLLKMKLTTKINHDYIQIQYFPFNLKPKIIYWNELTSFETRTADCLKEYWGWGYKGTKKNRSYTAYGDFGLQLTFKNGNRLFIGSQKKEEMEKVINEMKTKINIG